MSCGVQLSMILFGYVISFLAHTLCTQHPCCRTNTMLYRSKTIVNNVARMSPEREVCEASRDNSGTTWSTWVWKNLTAGNRHTEASVLRFTRFVDQLLKLPHTARSDCNIRMGVQPRRKAAKNMLTNWALCSGASWFFRAKRLRCLSCGFA